ncbi:hypothetical protein LY78DRAFT_656399 [Colletotrichum sublineola]|nr:hypothetical protein LY78DRAFT_656399 [Colletotrichum sublineola]
MLAAFRLPLRASWSCWSCLVGVGAGVGVCVCVCLLPSFPLLAPPSQSNESIVGPDAESPSKP